MALNAGEVEVLLKLRDELSTQLTAVRTELQGVSADAGTAGQKMTGLGTDAPTEVGKVSAAAETLKEKWVTVAAAMTGVVLGVNQTIGVFKDWIKESDTEEAALRRLETALRSQGTYTPELLQNYKDLGSEFQNTTRYSDDLIFEMEALLTLVGNVGPKNMGAALEAATNLASGLKIDLPAAVKILAPALAGGGDELGRLGKYLKGVNLEGANTAQVIAAVNNKFGGQAASDLQTYSGKIDQLQNKYGDVKEKAGALLSSVLIPLFDMFQAMPGPLQDVILVLGLVASAAIPVGTALGGIGIAWTALAPFLTVAIPAAVTAVTGAFATMLPYLGPAGLIAAGLTAWYVVFQNLDVFMWAAVETWEAVKSAWSSAATAITGSAKSLYEGVKSWLVDRFQAIIDGIKGKVDAVTGFFAGMYDAVVGHSYVPDMISAIGSEFSMLEGLMVSPSDIAAQGVMSAFQGMADGVGEKLTEINNKVKAASLSWSDAMAAVGKGEGTMTGTIQAPNDTPEKRAEIMKAAAEKRYYGPVDQNGMPDWKRLFPSHEDGGPTKEGPAYVHDGEYVVPKNGTLVMGDSGGGGNKTMIVQLVMSDGRELARAVVPWFPGELRRYGVA